MIERKFIKEKIKEYKIERYIGTSLKNVGHSHTKMVKTPLGEKIVIFASRPGLIVGKKGQNIKELTKELKQKFELENPQIEISEVENMNLDARIVAERMTDALERYGSEKFKAIGHKTMEDVMNAGALGVEIIISGKIPSSRAKSWRFYAGYLKKCGEVSISGVNKAMAQAKLKTGIIGVKVSIMPPYTRLPDKVIFIEQKEATDEKKEEGKQEEAQVEAKGVPEEKKKEPRKRKTKKPTEEKRIEAKKEEVKEEAKGVPEEQ